MRGGGSAEIAHRPKAVKRTKPAEDGKVVKRKKTSTGESKKAGTRASTASGALKRRSHKDVAVEALTGSGKTPKRADPAEKGKAVRREKTGEKGKAVKREKTGESSVTKARPPHAPKASTKADPKTSTKTEERSSASAAGAAGQNVEMKDVERAAGASTGAEQAESLTAPRLTGTPFEDLEPKLNSTVLNSGAQTLNT